MDVLLWPVGFIALAIREGGVRGGRDGAMSRITEGWRIHFFVFLRFFFRVCFLLVFWKVLEGSFGARMAHFGSILRSFGSNFCDFLGIRWISENVCFTEVKQ